MKAGASLEVRVLDRAQKTELGVGKLDTTDNLIDITTGTVKLRALFDNKDESLFPNQFVNVRLLVDTVKDATVVPVAAIQRGQPGTYVYLVKADDTVAIKVVTLGVTDGDKVQITSGLEIGDEVVIDGTDRLRDGAKIRRPSANPRATSGPPVAAAPPDAAPPDGAPPPASVVAPANAAQPQSQQKRRQGNGNGGGAGRPAQTNQ
jgi:multidrug efflux system membrane fusion protein